MCVIVHKPANVRISKSIVKEMFHANPHGCGLGYFADDGMVEIVKGLMDVKSAWRAINSLNDLELVIHFRWATHGPTSKKMTHPFSLRNSPAEAEGDLWTDSALFHNGVIGRYGTADMSDTLHFCCSVLANIEDLQTRLAVLALTRDKFAVMENGEVYLVGNFVEHKGMLVSNMMWSYRAVPARRSTVAAIDDDPWIRMDDGSYMRESDFIDSDDMTLKVDQDYYDRSEFFDHGYGDMGCEIAPEARIVDDMTASDVARRILEKVKQ